MLRRGPPGLTVARRCVRAATLTTPKPGKDGLSFGFSLSQDASVRYEISRRNGSSTRRDASVSRPVVGSSRMRNAASRIIARAIAMR